MAAPIEPIKMKNAFDMLAKRGKVHNCLYFFLRSTRMGVDLLYYEQKIDCKAIIFLVGSTILTSFTSVVSGWLLQQVTQLI